MKFRKRVKVYESPSPAERRRLEAHRLDALEQHRVRAHTDRGWPTAQEFVCLSCDVSSSRSWCWRCGADLSDSRPACPAPLRGAQVGASSGSGRGDARPDPETNGGV